MNKKYWLLSLSLFLLAVLIAASSWKDQAAANAAQPVPFLNGTASGSSVPDFDHIVIITLENKEFEQVIGNPFMPAYNAYARNNTLLTQYYAVTHPSLPNYMALIGGDTFGIEENCNDCFINAPSLPDLIEESGRTWKTYQEDMQQPCELGTHGSNVGYVQKHNPFAYFDAIRLNRERCMKSVVPLKELRKDIDAGTLPDFIFITPDMSQFS